MPKITQERYDELLDNQAKLEALEQGGVDNWEWYGESLKSYFRDKEVKEALADLFVEMAEAVHDSIEQPAGPGCGYSVDMSLTLPIIQKHINEFYTLKERGD